MTEYEQFDVELEPGDCVVSYTDALIESQDAEGEELGEAGLLRIVRLLGDVEPHKLIETVLKEIADRYPKNLSDDDVTMLRGAANGREFKVPFQRQAARGGPICGVAGARDRSRCGAASISRYEFGKPRRGAMIPALGRRWRAPR